VTEKKPGKGEHGGANPNDFGNEGGGQPVAKGIKKTGKPSRNWERAL